MPLLGTAATELAFSHIRKGVRKNEYSQFIGNHVGKEKNTMHIIKWFVEKTKQLVQSHRDQKYNDKIEKEYVTLMGDPNLTEEQYRQWCLDLTDEDLRQEAEESEREYLQQCKEEDERIAREEKELQAQIFEDKRTEKIVEEEYQILQQMKDDIIWKREQCPSCGYPSWECTCYLDEEDNRPEIAETTLIQRQCAEADTEEEPMSPEQEYWFTLCPKCNRYPEFCQCQYEE